MVFRFYARELPKAQPAVVLVLKCLRRRDNSLKSHPTDLGESGNRTCDPWVQDIGLSPTPLEYVNIGNCMEIKRS